jgi:hypothetical protein
MVGGNGDAKSITIPLLVDEANQPETEPPAEPSQASAETGPEHAQTTHPGASQRVAGLLIGGAGVAALGVGSFFGIDAISKASQARQTCPHPTCADANGVQTNQDAQTSATIADIVLGAGIAAVGVGAIVFFTAPKDRPAAPDGASAHALLILPAVTSSGGGLSVQGRF